MSTHGSPLHKVIDSQQWDAADFLGRLMVVVHAAFIHAGLVSAGSKFQPLPWIARPAGAPATLRYTIPQLVHRRRAAQEAPAAVVRVHVRGDLVILYSYLAGDGDRVALHWETVDARAVAPLLLSAGGLDDAARSLESDVIGVELWKEVLADGLCKQILDYLLSRYDYGPTFHKFMSLPDDLMAAVLTWLPRGEDLAAVECTCTKLRRLVPDRDGELWKVMYMEKVKHMCADVSATLHWLSMTAMYIEKFKRLQDETVASSASWKGRYIRYSSGARSIIWSDLWLEFWLSELKVGWVARVWNQAVLQCRQQRSNSYSRFQCRQQRSNNYSRFDARYDRSLLKDPLEPLMRRLLIAKTKSSRGNKAMPSVLCRRRHGKGGIHSSSSRYRWTHR